MAARSKVIFNLSEINTACEAAVASGEGLATVFTVGTTARPGPNGTKYFDLCAKVPGKYGRLIVRVMGEKHVGQIAPLDDAEVARINSERGGKYGAMKKRDRHPTINVQKYKVRIETDETGRPKGGLPGPEQESEYFRFVNYLDRAFYEEMQRRVNSGAIVLRDSRRRDYPDDAVVVSSTKIISLYQGYVSIEAKVNPGSELANPIARINMKFDGDSGMPKKVEFFDFTKRFRDEKTGKPRFEHLRFDGQPVTAHNIHHLASHSTVNGIVNLNAVCSSNMGLSVPTEFEVLIIDPPVVQGVTVDDVFGEGMFDDDEGLGPGPAPAPPAARPAVAVGCPTPAATGHITEDDLTALVGELDVTASH